MLKNRFELETEKERVYQVLFLFNDSSQDVEVHESKIIDFSRVEKHLKLGGAIFITGKAAQKIFLPEESKDKKNENDNSQFVSTYVNHI